MVETSLWKLLEVQCRSRQVRFRLAVAGGHVLDLVLTRRSDAHYHDAQTTGFNLTLAAAGAGRPRRQELNRLLFTLLPVISRNDDGHLVIG
jgi:hypothetical protein